MRLRFSAFVMCIALLVPWVSHGQASRPAPVASAMPPWMPPACWAMPLERGNVFASPTGVDPIFTINASAQYAIVGPVARGRVPVRMVSPIRSGTLYMDETDCHVVALARELQRSGLRYGISSACVGGGQGIALLLENPQATH